MLRIEVRRQRPKTEHLVWVSFLRLCSMVAPGKLPHCLSHSGLKWAVEIPISTLC